MSHWLTIWRAAQLVGVARGALQQQVRDGRPGAERRAGVHRSLLQLYPQARLEEPGLLERVAQHQRRGLRPARARTPAAEPGGAGAAPVPPEPGLADAQRHLQRYHALVVALQQHMRELARSAAATPALRELERKATQGLARALATESGGLAGGDGRYAEGHVGTGHGAPQRPRVLGRRPRHPVAGRAESRADAQLRLRQRHLRHVQGARGLGRGGPHPAIRLPAVRGGEAPGLHAGLRAHRRQQRADAGDCWRPPVRRISRAADRDPGARRHRTGARHAPAAPADAAQPPAALPGRAVGYAGPGTAGRRRARDASGGQLPLRRPQPAFLHRPRRQTTPLRGACLAAGQTRRRRSRSGGRAAISCSPKATRRWSLPPATRLRAGQEPDRTRAGAGRGAALSLFWLATRPDGHFLANQCRAWSEALDNFESRCPPCRCGRRRAADRAGDARRPVRHRMRFLPGRAAAFVDTLRRRLRAAGVPQPQIFTEVL